MSKETQKNSENKVDEEVKKTAQEGAVTSEDTITDSDDSTPKADDAAEAASSEPSLEERIAALEKEKAELKDQLLRSAADFDNYRKRTIKEKADIAEYANANLLGDLLDSLDNFDRTVEAAANATDPKSIADGISMINKNLVKMLEDKYGLVGYGAEGDEFNPDEHEAIGRMEEEVEKQTLKQVYLKGYKLKDKVIRHAKVMVSVPKA